MRHRLRAIPLPLALILALAAIQAGTWAVVMPPMQGPDEVSHFIYVQRIGERGDIPWHPRGAQAEASVFTAESAAALAYAGLGPLWANPGARPLWTEVDVQRWSRAAAAMPRSDRSNGGLGASSLKNPPSYYLYETLPYLAGRGGSFFDRAMLMRLANIPLLLIALVFVWLVAGELLARRSDQVIATAAAALLPQLLNITATINPDILLVAEWSAAIWLMLLVLRRGLRLRLVAALVGVVALGGFTHGRSLPLILPAILTLLIAYGRERGVRPLRPLPLTAGLASLYVVVVLAVAESGRGSVREFGSYLWQFYLPRLGFMNPTIGPPGYGFRQAFVERLYGWFAQLEVFPSANLAAWLYWLTIAGLVALVVALVAQRSALRRRPDAALVLGTTILALVLGLHLVAYRAMLTTPSDPIVTARYLLPLLPLFGAAIAIVARALPRVPAAAFTGLVIAGGVSLQLVSLGLLWERFYA